MIFVNEYYRLQRDYVYFEVLLKLYFSLVVFLELG
jgi:hypothetical protein